MVHELRVEIPDAYAGLLLARRLTAIALEPQIEGVQGDLWLASPIEPRRLAVALNVVEGWLVDIRLDAARVRVGEREWLVATGWRDGRSDEPSAA